MECTAAPPSRFASYIAASACATIDVDDALADRTLDPLSDLKLLGEPGLGQDGRQSEPSGM